MIDAIVLILTGFMFGYIMYEFIHRFKKQDEIIQQPDAKDMNEFCKDIHPTPVPPTKQIVIKHIIVNEEKPRS
jgi:hypothetical protein